MKKFFRHWQYGIKARVIDGALVANIDTAREPVFVRIDLARLQTVNIDVANKGTEYELNLVNIGAPGATTTLAKFEVRDAAEEAATCIYKALYDGMRWRGQFCKWFAGTLGLLAALALGLLLVMATGALRGGEGASQASLAALQGLQSAGQSAASTTPGEPVPADQFLTAPAQ